MSDRLATIVRAILKDKFIRAIGERKWTTQDEESINKLSDFFTEFDQRLTALEGWAETMGGYPIDRSGVKPKPTPIAEHTQEHCKIPGCIVCGGPTVATVERYVAASGEALFFVQTRAVSLREAQESIEGTEASKAEPTRQPKRTPKCCRALENY